MRKKEIRRILEMGRDALDGSIGMSEGCPVLFVATPNGIDYLTPSEVVERLEKVNKQ